MLRQDAQYEPEVPDMIISLHLCASVCSVLLCSYVMLCTCMSSIVIALCITTPQYRYHDNITSHNITEVPSHFITFYRCVSAVMHACHAQQCSYASHFSLNHHTLSHQSMISGSFHRFLADLCTFSSLFLRIYEITS